MANDVIGRRAEGLQELALLFANADKPSTTSYLSEQDIQQIKSKLMNLRKLLNDQMSKLTLSLNSHQTGCEMHKNS